MQPVTLHVRTEPCRGKEGANTPIFVGKKIIGEVKRGQNVLYTKAMVTDSPDESVTYIRDIVTAKIELWAVQNTDFQLTSADALTS